MIAGVAKRRTWWGAVKAYRKGGWPEVTVRHGHRSEGAGWALIQERDREAQRLIYDHAPDQLYMNYALLTRQAASELIKRRLGVHLAVRLVDCIGNDGDSPLTTAEEGL